MQDILDVFGDFHMANLRYPATKKNLSWLVDTHWNQKTEGLNYPGYAVTGGLCAAASLLSFIHGRHLQIFAISLHICAGVNLSFTFLLCLRTLFVAG